MTPMMSIKIQSSGVMAVNPRRAGSNKRNTTPTVVRFARQTAPKALVSVTFFEESVMSAKKMPSDKAMTFPVELESPDPPLIMKMATPAVMMRTGRNEQ